MNNFIDDNRLKHSIAVARKMQEIACNYNSTYPTILNMADMQIDNEGNDIGYTKRLENIKNRYGENSNVYQKCVQLVNNLIKEDLSNGD